MNTTVLRGGRPDAQQLVAHGHARLLVERGERLVHQQHRRVLHQAARDRDALLHAAGQLVRIALAEAVAGRPGSAWPAARRRRSSRGVPRRLSGNSMLSSVVSQGNRLASWKMTPTRCGIGLGDRLARGTGSCPRSAARRPASIISSEVLPQPLGPTITTKRPVPAPTWKCPPAPARCPRPGVDVAQALDLDGALVGLPRSRQVRHVLHRASSAAHGLVEQDGHRRQHDHAGEQLRHLEVLAPVGDQVADAGARGIHLGDHHAGEVEDHRDAQRLEQDRQHARHVDARQDLHARGAVGARDQDVVAASPIPPPPSRSSARRRSW